MAAVGILAALHRARALRRGAAGRHLDDRRLALLARDGRGALLLRAARCRSAASSSWPAASSATSRTRPRTAAGSRSARSSRSSGRTGATGVGRPDLIEKQFEHPDSEAGAEVAAVFKERTRDEWTAFAGEHDCCLEPILDLDEALDSELVRAREMVVELDQPGIGPVKQVGVADQALAHAGRHERRRARRSASTPTRCCADRLDASDPPAAAASEGSRVTRTRRPAAHAASWPRRRACPPARSSTTCARACCRSRSRRRATWRGTRASSSSACS